VCLALSWLVDTKSARLWLAGGGSEHVSAGIFLNGQCIYIQPWHFNGSFGTVHICFFTWHDVNFFQSFVVFKKISSYNDLFITAKIKRRKLEIIELIWTANNILYNKWKNLCPQAPISWYRGRSSTSLHSIWWLPFSPTLSHYTMRPCTFLLGQQTILTLYTSLAIILLPLCSGLSCPKHKTRKNNRNLTLLYCIFLKKGQECV
jgi:hypothetical protein